MNSTLINLNNKEFDLNNVCKVSFDLNLLKNFLFNLLEENFNKYQNFFQILNKSEKQNIQILKNQEEINKKLNVFESIINEKDENKENNLENNPKFISLLNRIKQLETKFDLNYQNSNNEKFNFIEKNINDFKYKINELNTKFKQLKNEFDENQDFTKILTNKSSNSNSNGEKIDINVAILENIQKKNNKKFEEIENKIENLINNKNFLDSIQNYLNNKIKISEEKIENLIKNEKEEQIKLKSNFQEKITEIENKNNQSNLDIINQLKELKELFTKFNEKILRDLNSKASKELFYNQMEMIEKNTDNINILFDSKEELFSFYKKLNNEIFIYTKKLEQMDGAILQIKNESLPIENIKNEVQKNIRKNLNYFDFSQFLEISVFDNFMKLYKREFKNISNNIEKNSKFLADLNENLKKKLDKNDLDEIENFYQKELEKFKDFSLKKFSDKIKIDKNLKVLDNNIQKLGEILGKNTINDFNFYNINNNNNNINKNCLLSKQSFINPNYCASCESFIGNLNNFEENNNIKKQFFEEKKEINEFKKIKKKIPINNQNKDDNFKKIKSEKIIINRNKSVNNDEKKKNYLNNNNNNILEENSLNYSENNKIIDEKNNEEKNNNNNKKIIIFNENNNNIEENKIIIESQPKILKILKKKN